MAWIILSILVGVVVIGLLVAFLVWNKKGKVKHETDYYGFFVMGAVWTAIGVPMTIFNVIRGDYPTLGFFLWLGVVYLAIGLANKDKWKKDKLEGWRDPKKRNILLILTALGVLLLIAGVWTYLGYGWGL